MEGHTKVKYQYNHVLSFLVWGLLVFSITACEKQGSDVQNSTSNFKRYNHEGLEVVYPEGWLFESDGQDLVLAKDSVALIAPGADRRVVFETSDMSPIFIYFYKNRPQNYLDSANSFVSQNGLETNEEVSEFQRKKVNINGYEGLKLNWTEGGIGGEIKAELTILQFRTNPYPVLVEFYFFDSDINDQNANIIPFLEGISFDQQGVKL